MQKIYRVDVICGVMDTKEIYLCIVRVNIKLITLSLLPKLKIFY